MIEHWGRGPERPTLATGIVHVWRATLDGPPCREPVLSRTELARAERFRFELDRRRWIRGRTILRSLLGAYLGLDAHAVEIASGDHGKPALVARTVEPIDNALRLDFNLSHSDELALYAFALDNPVGVDIELPRRPIDEGAFPWVLVGRDDARRVRAARGLERQRELLRAWVRTEAVVKCRGTGFSAELERSDPESRRPWLVNVDVGERGMAALAAADPPWCVRQWEWSESDRETSLSDNARRPTPFVASPPI